MLISRNLHKKTREVSIQTRSPPASLLFEGQATKHATGYSFAVRTKRFVLWLVPAKYFTLSQTLEAMHKNEPYLVYFGSNGGYKGREMCRSCECRCVNVVGFIPSFKFLSRPVYSFSAFIIVFLG